MPSQTEIELHECSSPMEVLLNFYASNCEIKKKLQGVFESCQLHSFISYVGIGSSLYSTYPTVYSLITFGVKAIAMDASESANYLLPFIIRQNVVLVSQSGRSPEANRIANNLAMNKCKFISVTNDSTSLLAACSAAILPLCCTNEETPSTKTYINSILLLPHAFRVAMESCQKDILDVLDIIAKTRHVDIVGCGPAISATYQASLVIREACGLKSHSTTRGLFRHGLVPSMRNRGFCSS